MTDHIGEANEKVVDLLENLAGADDVTDGLYVSFNGVMRHWRDAMNDAADLLQDSARRDAEEIERLRAALQWYANPEIYKPHPHGPAFDRRDLSYHAAATLRPQPFARAAHTGEG